VERSEATAKLKALRQMVQRTLGRDIRVRYFDPATTTDLFTRYLPIAEALRSEHGGLFGDLPDRKSAPTIGSNFDGRGHYSKDQLHTLVLDIEYCLTILEETAVAGDPAALAITKEGVFFAGQQFDAFLRVRDLVSQARERIDLIDGYVDERVLGMIATETPEVVIRILTKERSMTTTLDAAVSAFNKQHGGLEVRMSEAFHDRFLIIDDRNFYHFGASIKDAGTRGFMFSVIEEPTITRAIQKEFNDAWNAAEARR
jgi:hypothetical protein